MPRFCCTVVNRSNGREGEITIDARDRGEASQRCLEMGLIVGTIREEPSASTPDPETARFRAEVAALREEVAAVAGKGTRTIATGVFAGVMRVILVLILIALAVIFVLVQ